MIKKFCFLLLVFYLNANIASAENNRFIDGIEDVPLMNGLVQKNEDTISFGNEEARFVEVYLISPKFGFKKIEKFYKESLPQLGWIYQGTEDDTIIFYREGEVLSIHKENNKPLKIRITVKNKV